MNTRILAGAAAVAVALSPAALSAQGSINSIDDKRPDMTEQQMADYESWPEDRRTMYDTWTPEYQAYYWTLTPAQTEGWWVLNPQQRTQVYAMTPEQQSAAWNSIVAQMNGTDMSARAANTTGASTTAQVNYESNAMVQPVPQNTVQGEYPVCQSEADDACINPWAAGMRGPGVDRPLDYWPGERASG